MDNETSVVIDLSTRTTLDFSASPATRRPSSLARKDAYRELWLFTLEVSTDMRRDGALNLRRSVAELLTLAAGRTTRAELVRRHAGPRATKIRLKSVCSALYTRHYRTRQRLERALERRRGARGADPRGLVAEQLASLRRLR